MKRRTRSVAAILASAASVLVATAVPPTTAAAAPRSLTVAAAVRGPGDVRVSWSFTTDAKPRDRALTVERKLDGDAFVPLTTRTGAPLRGNYLDRDVPTRYATYRVVVADPTGTSSSAEAVVDTYAPLPSNIRPCPAGWAEEALTSVNTLRQQLYGRPPLVADVRLMRVTNERAARHAAAGRGSHARYREDARRYGFTAPVGENIGAGGGPTANIDGWMSSPGHRANLMDSAAVAGIGCAISDVGCCPGTAYWVFQAYRDPLLLWPT